MYTPFFRDCTNCWTEHVQNRTLPNWHRANTRAKLLPTKKHIRNPCAHSCAWRAIRAQSVLQCVPVDAKSGSQVWQRRQGVFHLPTNLPSRERSILKLTREVEDAQLPGIRYSRYWFTSWIVHYPENRGGWALRSEVCGENLPSSLRCSGNILYLQQ